METAAAAWYEDCAGQTLMVRLLGIVCDRHAEMALRSRLDPLEALVAFVAEFPVLPGWVALRFGWELDRANARLVERHRLLALKGEGARAGAPSRGRGGPAGKHRRKGGRRK